MKIYLKYISLSFQKAITYRIEYFTSLLNALLYIFIFISIWNALIPPQGIENGITPEIMTAYAVLSTLIKATFARSQTFLSSKVRTGEIAVDLMKPYSIPLLYLSDIIGKSIFQLFARGIPLLLFCIFVFKIKIDLNYEQFSRFLMIYFLAFIIYYFISLFLSSLSFYFVEIFPFWIMYFALVTLMSGAIIPIDFFPEQLKIVVLYTPFPYLFYFPTMILLRPEKLILEYNELLLNYIINIIILFFLSLTSYRLGIKKLTIAGG
ncbi:MAG: ABC transporter permease [Leptospiraceae bacterium]|nr:MAG: ABC transporter permease [Leptospiraceae bacterium]